MIPFKSKLSRYKNIENRNKAFNALTKEEQRREIAYEGLTLVLDKKVKASDGCYWSDSLHEICNVSEDSKDFQKKLLTPPKCEVCQRGLMMLAQIRLSNTISPNDNFVGEGDESNIKGFTLKTFYKMEDEYEKNYYNLPYKNNTKQKLANICCNIIHNGNFKTTDENDYLKQWDIKIPK